MRTTTGWAARGPRAMHRTTLQRRDLRPEDVAVRIDYCGVCHSDLHALDDHAAHGADHEGPFVPGHEFTGIVVAAGAGTTRFAVGDAVAVGNIVDACLRCDMCRSGQENYCREFPTLTYGGTDRQDGAPTLGGFSREYVVREEFIHPLPSGLDPAAAAPSSAPGSPSGNRCGRSRWARGLGSPWRDSAASAISR